MLCSVHVQAQPCSQRRMTCCRKKVDLPRAFRQAYLMVNDRNHEADRDIMWNCGWEDGSMLIIEASHCGRCGLDNTSEESHQTKRLSRQPGRRFEAVLADSGGLGVVKNSVTDGDRGSRIN